MKIVSNEDFLEAYGNILAPIDSLTSTQKINRLTIVKVTNRYASFLSEEERQDCGLDAMWKTLLAHKDGLGNKFTTSLWRYTVWTCRNKLRAKNRKRIEINLSLDGVEISGKEAPAYIADMQECLTKVQEPFRTFLIQYYVEDKTLKQIGDIHGCSKEWARQKINRGVKILRKIYE